MAELATFSSFVEDERQFSQSLSKYEMNKLPRGYCIIINNSNFPDEAMQRNGSEMDVKELSALFDHLGFTVIVKENLSLPAVRKLLRIMAKADHTNLCCLVWIMLSHGNKYGIQCSDGETLDKEELYENFSTQNCHTLDGKPKIFILQCCRGERLNKIIQSPVETTLKADGAHYKRVYNRQNSVSSLERGDIITVHATVAGYVAFRSESEGSVFIQTLAQVLRERKHEKKEFKDQLTAVKLRMSRIRFIDDTDAENPKPVGQVSTTDESLRKSLYFYQTPWQHDEQQRAKKVDADARHEIGIWTNIYTDTIRELSDACKVLRKRRKSARKAHLVGGLTTAGGGLLTAVGLICIPFSAGASSGIAGAGALTILVGLSTLGSATAASFSKNSEGKKIAEAALEVDHQLTKGASSEETLPINISKTDKLLRKLKPSETTSELEQYMTQIQKELEHRLQRLKEHDHNEWMVIDQMTGERQLLLPRD